MEKFGKSQPAKRVEDVRFLTGGGRYVDDIAPRGALCAHVFRSPVAHAVMVADIGPVAPVRMEILPPTMLMHEFGLA